MNCVQRFEENLLLPISTEQKRQWINHAFRFPWKLHFM